MTTTTPVERPPAADRTPEETPAALARAIAQLATAPVRDFVECISDEDNTRDHVYQQLVQRLTADEPGTWIPARENDVENQLRASLPTDEDRKLFGQLSDHLSAQGASAKRRRIWSGSRSAGGRG